MIRRPPRSTPLYSSAASDVYKRQRVALIGDEDVPVGEVRSLDGGAELVRSGPRDPCLAVAPHDLPSLIHEHDAVVGSARGRIPAGAGGSAGTGDEGEAAGHALRVVRGHDGMGSRDREASAELPDDLPVCGHLYDTVVELVGDEHIAVMVEGTLDLSLIHISEPTRQAE